MRNLKDYYNRHKVIYGISGDRKGKTFSLLDKFKNSRVLDVGCNTGYIGGWLRKKGNYVIGWDMIVADIAKAKKVLDEVEVVDLELDAWPKYKEKFDLIIFSEVIEHLFSPEEVLKRLLVYLKSDGSILITTPNIMHIYWRIRFLLGKFEYKDESVSVINPGHLHLFTHKSLTKITRNVGLVVEKENNVIYPRTVSFIWKLWPGLFAYQFICLFKKAKSGEYNLSV